MTPELAEAIKASAARLGVSPVDLGTVVSYETAGTFDPWKAGPTTQWGQHRGLIQWGEPQRAKYGVYQGMPVGEQMQAAERYLADAGFRPGMGLLDLYSAINAGKVGRYNASDAGNGGAPGTVADKVNNQMAGHRAKAEQFLGGDGSPPAPVAVSPAPTTTPAPQGQPSATPAAPSGLLSAAMAMPAPESPADQDAYQRQVMGLLAQATGQGQQQQQAPEMGGLMAEQIARFPQMQLAKISRRKR